MDADTGAMFVHTVTNTVGMVMNGLLIYLALTQTPKSIRTYSILILNFAITDFSACLMGLFVQQRLVPVGFSVTYISNGPCKYFGSEVCYIGYSIMLHCFSHTLYSLLLSFVYRFVVLRSRTPTPRQVIVVLLAFYSLSFFQFMVFSFANGPPEVIAEIIHSKFPDYDLTEGAISGNESVLEWKTLFTALHMTLPVSPVYAVIIYIRNTIYRILSNHEMSENTKTMHKQLLMALTFQAVLPSLYSISVLTYVIGQIGIYNHPLLEYTTFIAMGLLPMISPFGTLYFIRPYKNWILFRIFCQAAVQPKTVYVPTITNVSSVRTVAEGETERPRRNNWRA